MKVWVTRDTKLGCDITIFSGTEEPERFSNGVYDCPVTQRTCFPLYGFEDLPASSFKETFGFTPRKGSCKQYELTLKEIK